MKIEFDPQADTAYIELIEGDVERSKQIESGRATQEQLPNVLTLPPDTDDYPVR